MKVQELCEKFIEADKIINDGYYGTMTMEDKTKYPNFNKCYPMSKCETDMQLNGLSEDLFDQLGTEIENEYYEYFVMWLSDKLFKIAKEDDITLNSAYEKYLNKNIENWDYWSLLDFKEGLKEVNLKYMKQFYKLLNNICKAIVYYKQNDDDIEKLINYSSECSNQYLSLYNSVPKCSSYHHLLNNLKKTYDKFRNSVHDKIKKDYSHLAGDLQTLKTSDGEDLFVTEKFKAFYFNSSECNPPKAKEPTKLKETNPPSPQSLPVSSSQNKIKLQEPQKEGSSHPNGQDASKGEQKGSDDGHVNQPGSSNHQIDSPESSDDGKENLSSVPEGSKNAQGSSNGGIDSQGSIDSGSGGGSSGGKDSGANDGASGGSKALGDQDPTHPSGEPNGYLPGNWGMSFNLMGYMPSASSIYQSSKNILTNATNKISDTYTNTVDIVKGAYDSTVNNIKDAYDRTMTSITGAYNSAMTSITDAYDRTTNYIGNAVNSVTSQLNPFSTSQSDDNQPGSNISGGETDTSNHSQQNPPPPTPPSPSPSLSPSQSVTPPPPPQTPSLSQQYSNQTQDKLQNTVQNGTSSTLQQLDPNTGTGGVQTITITKATLSSSSTDPSITGSGITTGIVVKMNEKPSIWCIAQNKKYDILGIGIISISIFAFLAIMYKYISFGSAKNSKKKKSMRRVIKYGDGNRKTQIIIKSCDRSKGLKPVINSVSRKKYPLLNIYKLMQADPVPFINLFFLLIFFVYKRKYDFLEL